MQTYLIADTVKSDDYRADSYRLLLPIINPHAKFCVPAKLITAINIVFLHRATATASSTISRPANDLIIISPHRLQFYWDRMEGVKRCDETCD